jgi:hypothetical protein
MPLQESKLKTYPGVYRGANESDRRLAAMTIRFSMASPEILGFVFDK